MHILQLCVDCQIAVAFQLENEKSEHRFWLWGQWVNTIAMSVDTGSI